MPTDLVMLSLPTQSTAVAASFCNATLLVFDVVVVICFLFVCLFFYQGPNFFNT